jgi:hypothetical protein
MNGASDTIIQREKGITDITWGMNIPTNFKAWKNYGRIFKKTLKDLRRKTDEG